MTKRIVKNVTSDDKEAVMFQKFNEDLLNPLEDTLEQTKPKDARKQVVSVDNSSITEKLIKNRNKELMLAPREVTTKDDIILKEITLYSVPRILSKAKLDDNMFNFTILRPTTDRGTITGI